MAVDWSPHRFSGGWLALDVANTVVHRGKPDLRFDRFDNPDEVARFANVATTLREEEWNGREFLLPDPTGAATRVLALRERADGLFRETSSRGALATGLLPPFLRAAADCLDAAGGAAPSPSPAAIPFEAALALSALALLDEERWRRIRVCPNCGWLFLDKSRNGSRLWCDMAVCGNRAKARRHRHRHGVAPT